MKHGFARPRSAWQWLRMGRRFTQGASLALFIALIALTTTIVANYGSHDSSADLPYPVELFLNLDPFATLLVAAATGTVAGAMLLSLATLVSGILCGRFFCGWVCPMGTLNHLVSRSHRGASRQQRLAQNATRPYQKTKYYLLFAAIAAALLGSSVGALLDPIALATRGLALTLLPAIDWILSHTIGALAGSDNGSVRGITDHAMGVARTLSSTRTGLVVSGGFGVSVFFAAVLIANLFMPRFWCRGLCPLGGLLGLSGRFGLLTLLKNESRCSDCQKCELHCSGAASPHPKSQWQRAECDLCFNCVAECPDEALEFRLSGYPSNTNELPDLHRRTAIGVTLFGAGLVPAMRTGLVAAPRGRPNPECIRPPGAAPESDFLERCIRCGQCMKICPGNALHPSVDEAGLEGFWTPVLVPRLGYCEPTCTLCTQVCPTGALRTIPTEAKTGEGDVPLVRIGTAFFDRGRCLPWAMGTACIVCEEFCPVSPKAIWFSEERVEVRGQMITIKRPHVDPALCNGCGACEHVCPVHDRAAIRVSAAGETRNRAHSLLLQGDAEE